MIDGDLGSRDLVVYIRRIRCHGGNLRSNYVLENDSG